MPLVCHKRSQNAGVFTLDEDGMDLVVELVAALDGLTKSPLQPHQTTDRQSNPLHFGIGDTLVLAPELKRLRTGNARSLHWSPDSSEGK